MGPVQTVDTQQILQRFQEHQVNHIHREANRTAHNLAKLALSLGVGRVWREDFPACMRNIGIAKRSIV